MRPINNNYISVDAKDIVHKHDHPRAMYKWSNKENQNVKIDQYLAPKKNNLLFQGKGILYL